MMYAGLALAVMTKGPIGMLLPGLVILSFLAVKRAWRLLPGLFVPQGILLFILLTVPWYGAMYALYGNDFINTFFGVHNYLRATVSEHPKDNVFYYYFAIFVLSMLPWSALSVKALWLNWQELRRKASPGLTFLFIWIAAYFAFYSLMATKYPTYTFPVLFPLAVLTAISLERMLEQNKSAELLWWVGIPLLVF